MSKVEQMPLLFMVGDGQHRHQWVTKHAKCRYNFKKLKSQSVHTIYFFGRMDIPGFKLVGQSQIVQSVIYGSDTVVTQVLTAAVLSLGSQLGFFPFAEYDRIKT